jgi:AraC-like DNA-binding protein
MLQYLKCAVMPDKIPRYKTRILLHPSGFEVTSFHDFYRSKKAKERISKLHRVPFYQIFWFKEDNNSCYVNGDKIIVEKNSLLVLNKDVVHKFSQNILDGEIILFSNNFFRSTQEKIDFLNTCPLFKNAYSVIKPHTDDFASLLDIYFSFMKRDIDKNKNRELSVCRNLLHNLLMIAEREFKLQRKVFGKSPYSNYIAQFKSLLIEHYKTQKQVSFYAQAMEVSERKLSMMVSKRFGISAKEYINEKVFREAKRLLKYSTLNEKEIAHTIGFDLTYFIKFFKKYNDTTPGRFRNK